ncbi:ribosomal protein L5 [Cucumis melo var. makuwa]|uniref:Ribosomal protein L5 (Mitochondrion) n=1 Tax=Cucumis melo var. makuwa TaxID=1194695 RepID=A0A5A7V129_CUCMM|nr:ribosomal protein L5 [Cucumis melo var. makuwa]
MPRTQFSHPRVKSGSPTVSSLCSVFVISLSIFGARASSTSVHTPGMLLHTFSQGIGREESSLEGQLWCNPKGSKRWPMLPTAQPNDASNTTVPRMPCHFSTKPKGLFFHKERMFTFETYPEKARCIHSGQSRTGLIWGHSLLWNSRPPCLRNQTNVMEVPGSSSMRVMPKEPYDFRRKNGKLAIEILRS